MCEPADSAEILVRDLSLLTGDEDQEEIYALVERAQNLLGVPGVVLRPVGQEVADNGCKTHKTD